MEKITIHNVKTGEIVERDMNAQELKAYDLALEDLAKAKEIEANRVGARQAIFDRLGITVEEAAVLGL